MNYLSFVLLTIQVTITKKLFPSILRLLTLGVTFTRQVYLNPLPLAVHYSWPACNSSQFVCSTVCTNIFHRPELIHLNYPLTDLSLQFFLSEENVT